jgi:hypothetical protein
MRGEGSPALVNQRSQVRQLGPLRESHDRRSLVPGVQHGLERSEQLAGKLLKGASKRLHDLLRRALLQLGLQGAPQRRRRVLEPVEDHPPDSRSSELEQDRRSRWSEFSIDEKR